MISASRRVALGEKDKNASLHLQSPKRKSAMAATSSPNKLHDPVHSSSPQAGSKRKITEVEGAERVEEEDFAYQPASQSGSQLPYETSFELPQEEMSQRTLEKLNEVILPQNNSQPQFSRPSLAKEFSAGSVGLSAFINLDGPPSTQGSDAIQPLEEIQKAENIKEQETPEAARKRMIRERVAEMQTRLQLAAYKVQTKQTNQPFSRLKTPKIARVRSPSPPTNWMPTAITPLLSSSTIREPSSARTVRSPHYVGTADDLSSAEASIAAMRARATAQEKPAVRNLSSLPVPQLDPALPGVGASQESFSTLPMYDEQESHLPSSPPLSRASSASIEAELLAGIKEHARKDQDSQNQLSSPPASEAGATGNLLRSVSQGEAANGLVQLMTAS